jgi:phosphoglucomutase
VPTQATEAIEALAERYGDAGKTAAENLKLWLSGDVPFAEPEAIERLVAAGHLPLLLDSFWREVPIGTGGRRGRVGFGPNRFNRSIVATSIQGHCDFLRDQFGEGELTVVVANDVRVFNDINGAYADSLGDDNPLIGLSSRDLAEFACRIYAANGISSYLASPGDPGALVTTPELAWYIAELGTNAGANFSASHNPPDDNGLKFFNQHGGQPVPPEDERIVEFIRSAGKVKQVDFGEAVEQGLVRAIPAEATEAYISSYAGLSALAEGGAEAKIVYTPLCGCGEQNCGALLERSGIAFSMPPGQGPDGGFGPIPFKAPNPEVPEATRPAMDFADEQGAAMVLSSDPDADRIGLDIKDADGNWQHLTGNQIASALCYFLLADSDGPRREGIVVTTAVTTKLLRRIAEAAGSQIVDDLLVGFKYVAKVIVALEEEGRYGEISGKAEDVVFAAEESHGIMLNPRIRDKDAAPAALLLAVLHRRLAAEGKTLRDYYVAILDQLGGHAEAARSLVMTGEKGVENTTKTMSSLRAEPPAEIGGVPVTRAVDFLDADVYGPIVSDTDSQSRNAVQYFLAGFIVTVRPSGTEPKVKIYVQALPEAATEELSGEALLDHINARADEMATASYKELLLGRIGLELSDAALALPDIISLEEKLRFDSEVVPQVRAAIESGETLEQIEPKLKEWTAAMVPGADPLPAVVGPVKLAIEGRPKS